MSYIQFERDCPIIDKNTLKPLCNFQDQCYRLQRKISGNYSHWDEKHLQNYNHYAHPVHKLQSVQNTNMIICNPLCEIYNRVISHTGSEDLTPSDKCHIVTHSHTSYNLWNDNSDMVLCQLATVSIKY